MTILGHGTNDGAEVLTLDTFMTPRAFAQSGLPRLLTESGFRISAEGDVSEMIPLGTFTAGDKNIEGERDRMMVFFPDFRGESLLETALESNRDQAARERAWRVLSRTVKTLVHLARSGGHGRLPLEAAAVSGPESILCAEDGSLFILPPSLYRRCAANAGDIAEMENRLAWVHPDSASGERSFAFTAAALAYRIVTGNNPFSAPERNGHEKKTERPLSESLAREMRKLWYEPAGLAAPALSAAVTGAIDSALDIRKGDEAAESLFDALERNGELSALADPERTEISHSADFAGKKAALKRAIEAARKRDAFFRTYRSLLTGAGIALLAVGAIAGVTVNDMARKPTTKGMAPEEVVQKFYESVDSLDQEWPAACLAKGVKSDYGAMLTNIYVTTKVRESYERNGGVLSPALLFAHGKTDGRSVYGITNLSIERDGSDAHTYTVSFYLWLPSSDESLPADTEAADQMSVYRYRDRLTLALIKDRWRIAEFTPVERAVVIGNAEGVLSKLFEGTASDEPWAPDDETVQAAAEAEMRAVTFE